MNRLQFIWEALGHIRVEIDGGSDRITKEGALPLTEDGVPIRKLFISNIAQRTTYKDLSALFSKYGIVESCYLKRNNGKSNYAFITLSTVEEAIRAREDGNRREINLHDRDLRVMPANSWNQPDSIQNKSYTLTKDWYKSHKKSVTDEISEDYVQNYSNAPINALNDDCLKHIFLYLPIIDRISIERVCKRWRVLSQETWCTVKRLNLRRDTWGLSQRSTLISTANLREVLIRCGRFLNHVNFSESYHSLNRTALLITSKFCPNLETLDLSAITVSASGIESLAKNCKNIKKFSLGYTSYISDKHLITLFETNESLRYLNLLGTNITGRCLSFLPSDTFEELVLNSCYNIKESHFSHAFANLKNLKSLTMKNCTYVSSRIMEAIGSHCTNLTKFDVIPLPITWNDALQIIRLVNLRVLQLRKTDFMNDDYLITLASECRELIYLDISGCCDVTDIGLQALTTLPKLETLIISYLTQVTAVGLDNMCNIKHLECRQCILISDAGLSIFIRASPHLELLDLSGCIGITNDTIIAAMDATSRRSNDTILKIFVGGTSVKYSKIHRTSPYLLPVNMDLSDAIHLEI